MAAVKKVRLDYYAEQIKSRHDYLLSLIVKDQDSLCKIMDEVGLVDAVDIDQDEVLVTIGDLQSVLKELRELIK